MNRYDTPVRSCSSARAEPGEIAGPFGISENHDPERTGCYGLCRIGPGWAGALVASTAAGARGQRQSLC